MKPQYHSLAPFPGLHPQLLSLAVRKAGGKPGRIYHVMYAAADVRFSLGLFTLLSLNSVRSFCSVCPASPIATGSNVASYSTSHQQRHTSRDKSFQAFPPLFVQQAKKAERGGQGTRLP